MILLDAMKYIKIRFFSDEGFLTTFIFIGIVGSFIVMLYMFGTLYRGARLTVLGTDIVTQVDSIWITKSVVCAGGDCGDVDVTNYRFKGIDGIVLNIGYHKIGDSVTIRYYEPFNQGAIITKKGAFIEFWQCTGSLSAWISVSVYLYIVFWGMPYRIQNNVSEVYSMVKNRYQEDSIKYDMLKSIYKVSHYAIELTPSILSIFLNIIVILVIVKITLYIENLNVWVCGILVTLMLGYISFLSPYWIKWLYKIAYPDTDLVKILIRLIEVGTALVILKKLTIFFFMRSPVYANLFEAFNDLGKYLLRW
jgi:hypothetical protein